MKIIIAIIIFSLFLLGCDTIDEDCLQKASEKIPSTIEFDRSTMYLPSGFKWADGTGLDVKTDASQIMNVLFKRGSEEGQNINYYYNSKPLKYSKRVLSEEGNILSTNEFEVLLAVKSTGETKKPYNEIYEVMEYEIVSCNWRE